MKASAAALLLAALAATLLLANPQGAAAQCVPPPCFCPSANKSYKKSEPLAWVPTECDDAVAATGQFRCPRGYIDYVTYLNTVTATRTQPVLPYFDSVCCVSRAGTGLSKLTAAKSPACSVVKAAIAGQKRRSLAAVPLEKPKAPAAKPAPAAARRPVAAPSARRPAP